jgi:hypothetical protein
MNCIPYTLENYFRGFIRRNHSEILEQDLDCYVKLYEAIVEEFDGVKYKPSTELCVVLIQWFLGACKEPTAADNRWIKYNTTLYESVHFGIKRFCQKNDLPFPSSFFSDWKRRCQQTDEEILKAFAK